MTEKEFDVYSEFFLSILKGVHENFGKESSLIRVKCDRQDGGIFCKEIRKES